MTIFLIFLGVFIWWLVGFIFLVLDWTKDLDFKLDNVFPFMLFSIMMGPFAIIIYLTSNGEIITKRREKGR